MKVTIWGSRGSIACPGPHTARYGGNTACFELRTAAGEMLILDAGTGLRELGMRLLKEMPLRTSIVFSHTHYDHVMGYPFFVPFFIPGNQIDLHGPVHFDKSFRSVMNQLLDYSFFPVRMDELAATLRFHDLREEERDLGAYRVRTMYANHPVACLAFRIQADGKTIVYTGDTEPYLNIYEGDPNADPDEVADVNAMIAEQNEKWRQFLSGADLCIYDAQFTPEEYPKFKGWGHTSMDVAIDKCAEAGVAQLILTHHNPTRRDDDLDALGERWTRYVQEKGYHLGVSFAVEGRTYEV